MTRSTSRRTTALAVLLSCALLPAGALTANASTEVVAAALPAPTNLAPDDSGDPYPRPVLKTVRLDWSPVPNATSYRVEVGRDATWSDEPVLSEDVVSSELTLPVSLPHASYVWRVAGLRAGSLGHWSSEEGLPQSEAEFTRGWRSVPNPLGPSGVQTPGIKEFSWTPVPFASAYEVQVSDTDFGAFSASPDSPATTPSPSPQSQQPSRDICFTSRTRVTFFTEHVQSDKLTNPGSCISTLLGSGATRYWRVRALDQFTGEVVDGPTTPAATQISYLPPDPDGAPSESIGDPCPHPDVDDEKCEPVAPSEKGSWSIVRSFTMTSQPSDGSSITAPVRTEPLDAPADGSNPNVSEPDNLCVAGTDNLAVADHATCSNFPTLRWDRVPGATHYRVTVALDDTYSNIQSIIDTPGVSWTPTASWPDSTPSTAYFYTVQACNAGGCGQVDKNAKFFRKVSPRLVPGAVAPNPTLAETVLSWQSYAEALAAKSGRATSQDAVSYRVQVAKADHPSFDALVEQAIVDQTRYLSPAMAYPDGAYVWRVQAIDGSAHKLPWSPSRQFTKDRTAPRLVSVTPSSKVASKAPLKLTFSEPVTGVSSSSITLTPAAAATVTVTTPTTATLTPSAGWLPGATYRVLVGSDVKDLSGLTAANLGPTFTVNPLVDDANPAMAFSSGWRTLSSTNAVGGGFHSGTATASFKPSATVKFRGTAAFVRACMGPSNGYLDVYVDGVLKKHANLYRSFSGCGVVVANVTGLARANHTMKFVVTGQRVTASKGTTATVDAVNVTP